MSNKSLSLVVALFCMSLIAFGSPGLAAEGDWVIDSTAEWQDNTASHENLEFKDGVAHPTAASATLQTAIKKFDTKRSAASIVFDQSPVWQNWNEIDNVGPANLNDAPVMLSIGPDNYWIFGRYSDRRRGSRSKKELPKFEPQPATLEGFDVELTTTRFPNQYDAPGGRKQYQGGYNAWQSRDMVNWVHHGPVTDKRARWTTTAEYVDGKAYIYYDFPNDQDPHLYIDDDLTDGVPGKKMGMAFKDPSHGSDCGVIRALDGKFHIVYEDWSPISARKRSWDSPLAGHTVSDDGITFTKILAPAVDQRTTPTGEKGTYKHPHWVKEDPDNYTTNVAEYDIHSPEQEAYGDWAAIAVGGQYYLFGDYDPAGGHKMSVGWFTSSSLGEEFSWCDKIGTGHPDPDIAFAEGKFYLVTQMKTDYTSPGPWVESVEVRVGVDTNNDGAVNEWTDWQQVSESYDHTPGFARQIQKTPAKMDLTSLPEGFGFQFEVRLTDTTENKSKPMLDKVTMSFDN